MEAIITHVLAHTYTVARVEQRLGVLRHVLERLVFQPDAGETPAKRYHDILEDYADPVDQALLRDLGTDWLEHMDEGVLQVGLKAATARIDALPTRTVYVPTTFDVAAEELLGRWCRDEWQPELLLQLEVDPHVIGGCGFIANDIYTEHSLRTGLTAHPHVVANILTDYVSKS